MERNEELKGLGQVIRTLRELKEMSRGDLAKSAGLGVDMIAKVEQGAKRPSTSALKRIAHALELDAVELSARGLEWAGVRRAGEGSTALLQQVATGSAMSAAMRGAAVGAAGALLAATPIGLPAGAAALLASRRRRDRREMEDVLRAALEQRLSRAQTEEDLRKIAEALDTAIEDAEPPSAHS